ncbi:somatostatin receptor type 4-like [Saccostrea echinata]|uniref:somatostatin receptor type 4-like n=1 Tax=Saccostrea echinata TaxID=191078 RepID=UPI002A83E932|nr:somatostatin receptor type 4-like [Saccostrea echinata]
MGYAFKDPETNESVFTFFSEFNQTWSGQSGIEATILIIILIMAVVGNTMVVLAVFRNKKMRRPTNYFIVNLAVADLLFAAWIPFICITRITHQWVFGHAICKMVTYIQFVCGTSSILTMMIISIERHNYVCARPDKRITLNVSIVLIVIIWILSVVYPVPVAIAQTEMTLRINNVTNTFCGLSWPESFHVNVYLGCMVCLFFILPLVVISFNYVKIFRVMKSASFRTRSVRSDKRAEKQVRLTKMFIAIVCIFVVMWLPFFVVSFLAVYLKQITSTQFTITIILASANTSQNPVIYGFFNTKFQREFQNMCSCCISLYDSSTTYKINREEGTINGTFTGTSSK